MSWYPEWYNSHFNDKYNHTFYWFVQTVNGGRKPEKSHEGDACYDAWANDTVIIHPGYTAKVPLGFKVDIPLGWELQMRPRSGNAAIGKIPVFHFGTIDHDYRGELCAIIYNPTERHLLISKGDKIAQLKPSKIWNITFVEVEELEPAKERTGGFGSTGF